MNKELRGCWTQINISRWWVYGPLAVLIIVFFILNIGHDERRRFLAYRVISGSQLKYLGVAIECYKLENENQYPEISSWCDILIADCNVHRDQFICKAAVKAGDEGPCHYAMNPNCGPSSPNDVVLLFETKGGWNQYGGLELLTLDHHDGKGCNVLFADGHVEWVEARDIKNLKWEAEEPND
jgi:prepilin-type processing-associated H-X9-DG protein